MSDTERISELERELAEAKFDLQFHRELYALQAKELAEAKEQRDRLAEALRQCKDYLDGRIYVLPCSVYDEALAAVKGGSHE
jgi:hypothetical protein